MNSYSVDSGAAYVFVRQSGTWGQVAKLTASDGTDSFDYTLPDGTRTANGKVTVAVTESKRRARRAFLSNGTVTLATC